MSDQNDENGGTERRERPGNTTDFDVLRDDLRPSADVRTAPNPLRAANEDRLKTYRETVRRIAAARRAAVGDGTRY